MLNKHISSSSSSMLPAKCYCFAVAVKLSKDERRVAKRAISTSCREDYREHVNGILNDMEAAERSGNSREVSRLTRLLSGIRHNPSTDLNEDLLVTQNQLLDE